MLLVVRVNAVQVGTLVMQNLGYFQLKASSGLWELSTAPGPHTLWHLLLPFFCMSCVPACVQIVQVDTLVMQNLGYFQLKASPGLWELSIAPGRSRDLYQVVSATSGSALATGWGRARSPTAQVAGQELAESTGKDYATQVLMHSFTGGCAVVPVPQIGTIFWGRKCYT